MRSTDELSERFRAEGRRMTPQRRAVFEALATGPDHTTAEQVHRAVVAEVPGVSLKTVYQTLHELTELGELVALDLGTGALRFDDNLHPHHHLVCDRCGAVVDVPVDLTDIRHDRVSELGVTVTGADLVLRGSCASCPEARDRPVPPPIPEQQERHHG